MPKTPNLSRRPQYLVCGILCLGGFLGGTGQGWSSTALPSIQKSGHFPELNTSNLSWIASITLLGGFASSPTGGYLLRKFGRKNVLLISSIPYLIGWIGLTFPTQVWMLYVSRFLIGTALGLMIPAGAVYMSEIAEPDLRGSLSVAWYVAMRLGIIFEYAVGSVLSYNHLSAISAVISVAFGVCILLIPESPRWLIMKRNKQEAIDSMCWLRGCDKRSPSIEIVAEIQEIEEAFLKEDDKKMGMLTFFSTYFTNKAVLKSILIATVLMISKEASGGNIFSFYAVQVFDKTGSFFDSHTSGVIIGVGQLFGILLTTYYVDKIGRRILLIGSFIVMSFCLFVVGLYYQFRLDINEVIQNSGWIPLIVFLFYHAGYSAGPFVLTATIASEIIPTHVIGSVFGVVASFSWISSFVSVRYYEDLNYWIGVAATFWLFAGLSAAGAVFIHFVVPETVGKSLENIHKDHDKNNRIDEDTKL